jgi:hypothetical protein
MARCGGLCQRLWVHAPKRRALARLMSSGLAVTWTVTAFVSRPSPGLSRPLWMRRLTWSVALPGPLFVCAVLGWPYAHGYLKAAFVSASGAALAEGLEHLGLGVWARHLYRHPHTQSRFIVLLATWLFARIIQFVALALCMGSPPSREARDPLVRGL